MIKKHRIPILLLYYFIVMILLSALPITATAMVFLANNDITKAIIYLNLFFYGSHLILFFVCFLSFGEEIRKKVKEFLLNWRKNVKYIIIGFVMILIATFVMGIFFQQQGSNQESLSHMQQSSTSIMLLCFYIVTIILGPINEEFIFRRILIGEGKKYFPTCLILLVSSIAFGLIHIHDLKEILLVIPYAITGIILGTVYYKSDNIITSITLHILNNFIGVLLLSLV